jgi:putative spermidine/putrescine transport system ATP-binding protein
MVMADRIVILDAGHIAQQGAPEQVYNNPVSPFVASFLGAGNSIRLKASAQGGDILIEPGPHNSAARLARGQRALSGNVVAHFRSEAARLVEPGAPLEAPDLVLKGQIAQISYPGGFWRYAVRVGDRQFLVDDPRRLDVGAEIGIRLPASGLHLYQEGGSLS